VKTAITFLKSVRPRAWVLCGVVLAIALFAGCPPGRGTAKSSRAAGDKEESRFGTGMPEAVAFRNLVEGYGARVGQTERGLTDISKKLDALAQLSVASGSQAQNRLDALEHSMADRVKSGGASFDTSLRKIAFAGNSKTADKARTLHIPAGSFGEATLLTGVFAPVNGDAMPVLIKLDAALIGPNKSRVPVTGVFLVGKAVGDANSRRVVVQLDTLSLVLPSAESHEYKVNGFVVDKDGTQGMDGVYVWRAEEILALAGLSGGASGAADAFGAAQTTTTANPLGGVTSAVTGDAGKFVLARAASAGLGKIADIIADRLKEIQAAVYVANTKKITVSFLSGVTLEGYTTKELSDDPSLRPYRGLDHDR